MIYLSGERKKGKDYLFHLLCKRDPNRLQVTQGLHGSLLSHSSSMAGKCQVQGKYLHMLRQKGLHFVFKASKGAEGKGETEIIFTNAADLQSRKEKEH